MKNLSYFPPLLFSLSIFSAFATIRYVAQSAGSSSGRTACNGQTATNVSTFNISTFNAGDIAWNCETITAAVAFYVDGVLTNVITAGIPAAMAVEPSTEVTNLTTAVPHVRTSSAYIEAGN
jgi:hypothetical protein